MYNALFHIALSLNYIRSDKKLTEKQKNEISILISNLLSYLNETYYDGKYKVR